MEADITIFLLSVFYGLYDGLHHVLLPVRITRTMISLNTYLYSHTDVLPVGGDPGVHLLGRTTDPVDPDVCGTEDTETDVSNEPTLSPPSRGGVRRVHWKDETGNGKVLHKTRREGRGLGQNDPLPRVPRKSVRAPTNPYRFHRYRKYFDLYYDLSLRS